MFKHYPKVFAVLCVLSGLAFGSSHVFVGLLTLVLVYILYRFNERRVAEVMSAESEKRRRLEEMNELQMNTIEALAIAIDAKDQTTHGHVRRTRIYALGLGKLLGVSPDEMNALRAGALLHDVGKLAVPEYILNKPGKLTAAEFEKMKIHTVVGGDIIKRVGFPYPVEEIVRYHHEKWDGAGYPKGLRGEQIPLVARIISVVDFYDATRCDRPFRAGMQRDDSLALLREMAGSSFDPRVVEVFQEHVDSFDSLIAEQDMQEQVQPLRADSTNSGALPNTRLTSEVLGATADASEAAFRSIAEAQREVFALHEIAQTIGSSLNLQDTLTLVAGKLRAIVPFDTCVISFVDDNSGKALPAHVAGADAEAYSTRRTTFGEGVTGWVIANARSMCSASPELELLGVSPEVAAPNKGVLASPLLREDGAFGAITLYTKGRAPYTTDHTRLLESVCHHASHALNNALIHEKTMESALTDPLTNLPNSRALHLTLEQRIAECQRMKRAPLSVLCMDLDDFRGVNDAHGHGIGDRLLALVAEIVKKQLRQMDMLARCAGDEFVAIMPTAAGDVAGMVAERVRAAVESHDFPVGAGRTTKVNISVGVACFPSDGDTGEEILSAAERNMQRDKNTRKFPINLGHAETVISIDAFR